ncbi:MFS transporter [Veronia nyctiphanis]|nr:MFS transporter [Veronia nyctiphanis]
MLAVIAASMTLSTLIAPVLGGAIAEIVSWRHIFSLLVLLGLSIGAAVLIWIPETNSNTDSEALRLRRLASKFQHCWHNRAFLVYTLTISLVWSAFFLFIVESSFIYQGEFDVGLRTFALIFALISQGYICGSYATKKLVSKVGADRLISYGLAVSTLALMLLTLSSLINPEPISVTTGMFVFLFGCG